MRGTLRARSRDHVALAERTRGERYLFACLGSCPSRRSFEGGGR